MKNTKDTKYISEWLNLGGIALGIGIAFFSVLQPWVAMGLGILAAICFFSAWYLSRKERKLDAMAAEQRVQKVRQEALFLVQQAQDDTELRIEERFDEFENDSGSPSLRGKQSKNWSGGREQRDCPSLDEGSKNNQVTEDKPCQASIS